MFTVFNRLQVAVVRSDQNELEICRGELAEQHRTLALMARTLNSSRSSKRAVETGILEKRLKEQLISLEVNKKLKKKTGISGRIGLTIKIVEKISKKFGLQR